MNKKNSYIGRKIEIRDLKKMGNDQNQKFQLIDSIISIRSL